jgi:hypothetical protein
MSDSNPSSGDQSAERGERRDESMVPSLTDGQALPSTIATTPGKSLWNKTKEKLNAVSAKTASAGGVVASKATELGSTSATKAVDIGKQSYAVANEATRGAFEVGKQAYTGSKLESVVSYLDGELEERGAKKAIQDTTGAVLGKVDQVTGKRLLELLEEKLRVQDTYNDVLATRLAEALQRIAKLEAVCKKLASEISRSKASPDTPIQDG